MSLDNAVTATFDTLQEAHDHVSETAPAARLLPSISEQTSSTWFLDATAREIWIIESQRSPVGVLRIDLRNDLLNARTSIAALAEPIIEDLDVLDKLRGIPGLAEEADHAGADFNVPYMKEVFALELAARRHRASPAEVDGELLNHMAHLRAELAYLSLLRAHHIRDEYGTEHGSKTAAAAGLGVSNSTITGILSSADARVGGIRGERHT